MIRLILEVYVLTQALVCSVAAVAVVGCQMLLDTYRWLCALTDGAERDLPDAGEGGAA